MKKTFDGYYRPIDDEFLDLWTNCLFVLDASVLLNLYRYTSETRESFFALLEDIRDRLWVPHQAALEYQQNRLSVIEKQVAAYDDVKQALVDARNRLDNELRSFKRHPSINVDSLLSGLAAAFTEAEHALNELENKHPNYLQHDPIRDKVTALLEDRVGPPYQAERMAEVYREGKTRYEAKMPPGYSDSGKGSPAQYGDLVFWMQVIDNASEVKKPVILVTDDRKEDWWLRSKGATVSPRPELLQEMHSRAGVRSYIYAADPFLEYASKYLKQPVTREAIDEVRDIRQSEEQQLADGLTTFLQQLASPDEEMRRVFNQLANPTKEMKGVYQQLAYSSDELKKIAGLLAPQFAAISRVLETLPPGWWDALAAATEARDRALSSLGDLGNPGRLTSQTGS